MRRCDGRPPLLDHFSALRDQRQVCKVIYPLPEILLIVLYGVLAGGGGGFRRDPSLGGAQDRPSSASVAVRPWPSSYDTLNDMMKALPAPLFADCFTAWMEELRETDPEIVAIDGKTSRRARGGDVPTLHLVSA